MAYGVSCTTFLLTFGVTPAVASARVKTAEMPTTLVSGLSHLKFGNVDRSLFWRIMIPGLLGGVLGALVLSSLELKNQLLAAPIAALICRLVNAKSLMKIVGFLIIALSLRNLWDALF